MKKFTFELEPKSRQAATTIVIVWAFDFVNAILTLSKSDLERIVSVKEERGLLNVG